MFRTLIPCILVVILALLLLGASAARQPQQHNHHHQPLAEQKRDVLIAHRRFVVVYRRRDVAQLRAFYARGAVAQQVGGPALRGRARILASLRRAFRVMRAFDARPDGAVRHSNSSSSARGDLVVSGTFAFSMVVAAPARRLSRRRGTFRTTWRYIGGRARIVRDETVLVPGEEPTSTTVAANAAAAAATADAAAAEALMPSARERRVLALTERYFVAYNRGDVAQLAGFYVRGAVVMFPGMSAAARGRAAIRRALAVVRRSVVRVAECANSVVPDVDGRFTLTGECALTVRQAGGGEIGVSGTFTLVWQFVGGKAKIVRGMAS